MPTVASRVWLAAFLGFVVLAAGCARTDPNTLLESSKALHRKGERNAAIVQLKGALQEHPDHAESRLYLGLLYREAGDPRSAEKELRRALELKVDHARVLPALAHSLILQGELKKALDETNVEGLTDARGRAELFAARGLAYLGLKQVKEASASFEEALRLQPEAWEAMLGRARVPR